MTNVLFNWLMIAMILVGLGLIAQVWKTIKTWRYWVIPIIAMLLWGLFYSIIYIIDSGNGAIDPILYNSLNQWLRVISYITVILYLIAFIALQRGKHGQ